MIGVEFMSLNKLQDEWLENKNHIAFLPFRLSLIGYFLLIMSPSIELLVGCIILSIVLFVYGKFKVKENNRLYQILTKKE